MFIYKTVEVPIVSAYARKKIGDAVKTVILPYPLCISSDKEVLFMDTLIKIFPFSFRKKKDIGELILNVIIHLALGVAVSMLILIFPPLAVVSGLADLYLAVGIVLSVLNYLKVL